MPLNIVKRPSRGLLPRFSYRTNTEIYQNQEIYPGTYVPVCTCLLCHKSHHCSREICGLGFMIPTFGVPSRSCIRGTIAAMSGNRISYDPPEGLHFVVLFHLISLIDTATSRSHMTTTHTHMYSIPRSRHQDSCQHQPGAS